MNTRLVLADDQALVRRGFRLILTDEPDLDVVGEAEDGAQAMAEVRRPRAAKRSPSRALSVYTVDDLRRAEQIFNNRPRRVLDWKTPDAVFTSALA